MVQFADDQNVAFGDVMLRENRVVRIHGTDCQIALDGWPSMRYFNQDTGYGGKKYNKLTDERICTELSMVSILFVEYNLSGFGIISVCIQANDASTRVSNQADHEHTICLPDA